MINRPPQYHTIMLQHFITRMHNGTAECQRLCFCCEASCDLTTLMLLLREPVSEDGIFFAIVISSHCIQYQLFAAP